MINYAEQILKNYKKGQRYFTDIELENESFDDQVLQGVVFENCFISSSFKRSNLRNAKFINGNIKTCDFREADLTNAHFENLSVEGSQFAGAKTEGIFFDKNWAYEQKVSGADFEQ